VGRASSRCVALILIRKNFACGSLTHDERRAIFEDRSRHIAIGLAYLPAIARRLHHCRDLEADQPFDFLTWFEFAADDNAQVDELATALRRTPEWRRRSRDRDSTRPGPQPVVTT